MNISNLEIELSSPMSLALLRMKMLKGSTGIGLSSVFLPMLKEAVDVWVGSLNAHDSILPHQNLLEVEESITAARVLAIYKTMAEADPTLGEELAREGAHAVLCDIMKIDAFRLTRDEDQDVIIEMQDLAAGIASKSRAFPVSALPFTIDELRNRLPLSFPIIPATVKTPTNSSSPIDIEALGGVVVLIHQVMDRQKAQEDVGFVMWPSAVALARWLVTNPIEVHKKSILELGAGCGLTGLVAARMKSSRSDAAGKVILTDFNETVVENAIKNIGLNGLERFAAGAGLDFYQQNVTTTGWCDTSMILHEQVDLILAADVICQPEDAYAVARSIFCGLSADGRAVVVSANSKHRFGVEKFETACWELGLKVVQVDVSNLYDGMLLLGTEMEKTSGYVESMALTMYTVMKR